jgi:hypothetical protein
MANQRRCRLQSKYNLSNEFDIASSESTHTLDNSYINAALAATIAQAESLAMIGDRLSNVDREKLHARVMKFMSKTQAGPEPSPEKIERAIR